MDAAYNELAGDRQTRIWTQRQWARLHWVDSIVLNIVCSILIVSSLLVTVALYICLPLSLSTDVRLSKMASFLSSSIKKSILHNFLHFLQLLLCKKHIDSFRGICCNRSVLWGKSLKSTQKNIFFFRLKRRHTISLSNFQLISSPPVLSDFPNFQ